MVQPRILYVTLSTINKGIAATIAALVLLAGHVSAEPARIVALGDSLVQGFGLFQEDGLVPQLNRWLEREGIDAVVENAGVSGDTTAGGAARIDWTLESDPDALIVLLGGNDLLRGIDPGDSRQNLDHILNTATARGVSVLLIGHEAPPNFGLEYKREFESIFLDLAGKYDIALFEKIFAPLDVAGDRSAARLKYMQADGLHPNRDGVVLITGELGPFVAELVAGHTGQERGQTPESGSNGDG